MTGAMALFLSLLVALAYVLFVVFGLGKRYGRWTGFVVFQIFSAGIVGMFFSAAKISPLRPGDIEPWLWTTALLCIWAFVTVILGLISLFRLREKNR